MARNAEDMLFAAELAQSRERFQDEARQALYRRSVTTRAQSRALAEQSRQLRDTASRICTDCGLTAQRASSRQAGKAR